MLPAELAELQGWMVRQLESDIEIDEKACAQWINLPPAGSAKERLLIYRENVWKKQIQIILDSFPFTALLFEKNRFIEEWIIPFLKKHPICCEELTAGCFPFLNWLEQRKESSPVIVEYARGDQAITNAVFGKKEPYFVFDSTPHACRIPLQLQPHAQLIRSQVSLFKKSPQFQGCFFYLIYRTINHRIVYERLSEEQFHLISLFKNRIRFDEAVDSVMDGDLLELYSWFVDCCEKGLFYEPVSKLLSREL